MIFFVIDDARRTDFRPVSDTTAFSPTFPRYRHARLVAWNEVYPVAAPLDPYANLRGAVWAAAGTDEVCLAMMARLDELYDLDPRLTFPAAWATVVRETLDYWAHPRIGNISANWDAPPQRPAGPDHYPKTWEVCDFLDDTTKAAIRMLDANLPPPARSARDQVRICHNILDLARAVVGELTSYVAKRLEKLLALELCESDGLEAALVELLAAVRARQASIPDSFTFRQTEYCRYYFAALLDGGDVAPSVPARVLEALWDTAIMRPLASVPDGYDRYLEIWHKLPPVIRSAVLVNDIRKTLLASAGQEFNLRATHLKRGDVYGFGEPSGTIPLTIEAAQRFRSGWRFVEHWTRDERHPATCSARRLLTPTWAGPSGHVAKNLAFYRMFLPPGAYPASADTSIAAALFAVWRLYYDRRYSPTHTLVETCEGTTYNTDLTRVDLVRRRVSQDGNHDHDDAFSLFGEALLTVAPTRIASRGAHFTGAAIPPIHPLIDGVTVLELMRRRAFLGAATANTAEERLAAVDAAIDARRTALTQAGYVVPRWSHELDPTATGTAVTNFAPPDAPAGRRRRRQPQGAGAT